MSHTRPQGLGWVEHQATPVETLADPPGDGIGPDHTPPDDGPGLDPREVRRLQRDHRALTKGEKVPEQPTPDLHESAEETPTRNPFAAARATGPTDPREGHGAS